jgi:hypothetical protein
MKIQYYNKPHGNFTFSFNNKRVIYYDKEYFNTGTAQINFASLDLHKTSKGQPSPEAFHPQKSILMHVPNQITLKMTLLILKQHMFYLYIQKQTQVLK